MELLPKLDTSWMGKPSVERLALDWLGYFDERVVLSSSTQGKTKRFCIKYIRRGLGYVTVDYSEKAGATTVDAVSKVKEADETCVD